MNGFETVREKLRAVRQQRRNTDDAIASAREGLKQLTIRENELRRAFVPEEPQHVALRNELTAARARLAAALARLREERDKAVEIEAGLIDDFAPFTDPTAGIENLDDSIPILMMPVRLETRFKKAAPGTAPQDQLWVRVYPDDCWVDTFDPVLTTSELEDARNYWIAVWQSGGVEEQQRGAWRSLATAHGSGRSAWIVEAYRPDNATDTPTKAAPEDVILTIVVEKPLSTGEAAAVAGFWIAVWEADGEAAAVAAARATLDAAVGSARADELVTETEPANIAAPLAAGFKKPDIAVAVAYLVLPRRDVKESAWARPPQTDILPDRFVFIGYETADDATPVIVVGRPVPSSLVLGPDPSAAESDQLQHDTDGSLVIPDDMLWMVDFERAVSVGMGIVVNLTPSQGQRGFERVVVLGLRLSADEETAKTELEELFQHHSYRRTGLAVLPQGTPTNNTEDVPIGRPLDDPDSSFNDLRTAQFQLTSDWLDKSDGQWVAEFLGIDPAIFAHAHSAGARDQVVARAMNIAMWPATFGYWMETMMSPVFDADAVVATREFFSSFVLAGGGCPAIRIGEQPYGILPATAFSRMRWFERHEGIAALDSFPTSHFLQRLYPLLLAIDQDYKGMVPGVAHVGAPGDPHGLLLDILGLHSGSVEWAQRYAESLQTLFNRLNLVGLGSFAMLIRTMVDRIASHQKLTALGYMGEPDPPILDLSFSGRHNALAGGVVDDQPLSESAPIRPYTDAGDNYVRWLIDAANTSLDALYRQQGFTDDKPPTAIFYLLLRHALQLGYHDVSIRLFESAGIYTPAEAIAARSDDPFLHIRDNELASESKYFQLYTTAPLVTNSDVQPMHEFIGSNLHTLSVAAYLSQQLQAIERLVDRPTAQLERAFADHIDCCSYRLDAWLLGIVNAQLAAMRNVRDGSDSLPRQGIYLGAYAWLEPLRPEGKVLEAVELADEDLIGAFAEGPPLTRDITNQGYVHAPSLNQAVAAAVLRNGYISNASPQNRQAMGVNLTSARVRTALAMIEGIRAGQTLSSLLGYQFERGLHDRHIMAEVDKFIYKLRKAFPIRADRIASTKTEQDVPIEAIEARNVIDGLALVEHMLATRIFTYPFGKGDTLPTASPAEQTALDAEANRLLEAHDAVADLALSEGVYQAVLGNYDRVASTYDAYARGNFPPEPDIVRTPLRGVGITHRVALHLEPGVSATTSALPGLAMTPRAQAEPGLNRWLARVLPEPGDVACAVTFRSASTGNTRTVEVTLADLRLQPADLVAIIRDDSDQAMSELDDRILQFAAATFDPRPDVPVTIEYMKSPTAPYNVFELMPLVRNLRRLTSKSRALRPTDLSMMNEAKAASDARSVADKSRLGLVRGSMQALRDDIASFVGGIEAPLGDLANRRNEILNEVDDYVTDLAESLARAATFAIAQAGWGFAYDFKRRSFVSILERCAGLVERWDQRLDEFQGKVDASHAATTDDEKLSLLAQAERVISTAMTFPLPSTPATFENDLVSVKRAAFVAKQQQFAAVAGTNRRRITDLIADVRALLPISDFDVEDFSLADVEGEIVTFAQDAVRVGRVVLEELDRRLQASQDLLDEHDASSHPSVRLSVLEGAARALLGEDFRIYPEFKLTAEQGGELANAMSASVSGDLFRYLTNPPDPQRDPVDFPVDEWLYGAARVREKLHAWEQTVMYTGALGRPEPDLVATQLPFTPDDYWVGLDFPLSYVIDGDRLLYTAHHAAAFDAAASQCGLLLDEWTETIPIQSADTGIVFHHDRPNSEAPQSMLLVTPTDFRGQWRWEDLLNALNETLDLAKRRAIEPADIDTSPYAPFVPATVVANQVRQLTIAVELALNNAIAMVEGD